MKYKNPRKHPNGFIDCEIEHPTYGWIPYTCSLNDKSVHFNVPQLYHAMNSDPNLFNIVYKEPTEAEKLEIMSNHIRNVRNSLLEKYFDPVVSNSVRWNDLSEEEKNKYTNYRKELLDITLQEKFPYDVTWPKPPTN